MNVSSILLKVGVNEISRRSFSIELGGSLNMRKREITFVSNCRLYRQLQFIIHITVRGEDIYILQ